MRYDVLSGDLRNPRGPIEAHWNDAKTNKSVRARWWLDPHQARKLLRSDASQAKELRETFNDLEAVEIIRYVAGKTGQPAPFQNVRREIHKTETGTVSKGGVRGVYKIRIGAP